MEFQRKTVGDVLLYGGSILALGSIAYLCAGALRRGTGANRALPPDHVRDAGPDNMQLQPKRWDVVDQTSDESFPASDPPGNY